MSKSKEVIKKDEIVQAILIADGFNDDFKPITDTVPLSLLPVVNKPLIDYTLDFLSLGGIEETFLFCTSGIEEIRAYVKKCKDNPSVVWAQTMKVHVVVSETCGTLGDCMRDLDGKGLIRGNFVLIESGVVSNIKLLPLLQKHNEIANKDKGTAMTILCQESGLGQYNRCPREELVIAANTNTSRLLFYKKIGLAMERKLEFPLEIFLENSPVSIHHNLKDTFIAICSPVVLPLFSDNFDFQTKDDFVRGLIMNEEILGCTVYWHLLKGSQHAGTVSNLRMYHAVSQEIISNRLFPMKINLRFHQSKSTGKSVVGENCTIPKSAVLLNSVLGDNVTVGENVTISDSYIHEDVKIHDNCKILRSLLSNNCTLRNNVSLTDCVLGPKVALDENSQACDKRIQSYKSEEAPESLSTKAYVVHIDTNNFGENDRIAKIWTASNQLSFNTDYLDVEYDDEDASETSDDDDIGNVEQIDDTKLFFNEVFDSLARGYEDNLHCDNLILEINSSRYAYNITLKEVNYNVVKAIMSYPFSTGDAYLSALRLCLQFFSPIWKNYIKNDNDMYDCLQAIQDISVANVELANCVVKVLHYLYDNDYVSEIAIVAWHSKLNNNDKLHTTLKPFVKWLLEAAEESSEEE